jgi:arylsulfatase A-like enzyme
MGKQNMYDHSMRTPLILKGPGIPEGRIEKMEVYLQDIMPTAIEYAGGTVPSWVEFNSLKPFIEGEATVSNYPEVYGAYMDLQRMIRVDDYKLIVYPKARMVRLFDLVNDPLEMHDLATATRQRDRIRSMFRELKGLQAKMGDTLDLSNFNYYF